MPSSDLAQEWEAVRAVGVALALGMAGMAGIPLGCAPAEPELRSRYQAALDGFEVRQQPRPQPDPLDQDIVLHLTVRHDSPETLPRLPLEVARVDPQGRVRERRQVWIDTSRIEPGRPAAVAQRLEDVDYQPGDVIRIAIPKTDDGPSA